MSDDGIAVRCGTVTLTVSELRDAIRREQNARTPPPGSLVLIRESNRLNALIVSLAVREAQAVPLLGDDRWDEQFWAELQALLADPVDTDRTIEPNAWAVFSSGSSGAPRVILRSAASWSQSFAAVTKLLQLTAESVLYLPGPLSSSLSLFSVAHARHLGATIVLPATHGVGLADLAEVTAVHCTPFALQTIVEAIEAAKLPHRLRTALVGGANLDSRLRQRAESQGIEVVSYYGAAELSFVAVDVDGLGFLPFPGVELRVENETLWVHSAFVAAGYLGAAGSPSDAGSLGTAGSLQRQSGGWASVGDLVRQDSSGRLHFRGRQDDAIQSAASTVVPEEVETALRTIDGIADAAVFGLPNTGVGKLVAAVLELAPGLAPPTASELRLKASTRLSPSHLPRRWFFTPHLPRTANGKLARARLIKDALDGRFTKIV